MKMFLLCLAACLAGCTAVPPGPAADAPAAAPAEDANLAIASGVSGSDIWVGDLTRGETWTIGGLRNITTRRGYDNQPAFTQNGSGVYFSAIRDGAQADVYLYEMQVTAGFRFTATPQSEFSPMPLPGEKGISVVRVERDGRQGLWRYAGNEPTPLLADVDNVGYYTWLDEKTVALFLVDEPPRLAIAEVPDGTLTTIPGAEPGRSLQRVPGGGNTLSFVNKAYGEPWWICTVEPGRPGIDRLAPVLGGGEDFAWTPGGQLVMAEGRTIHVWRHNRWVAVADLSERVSGRIGRIAIDPLGRQIALAAAEGGS